jgi:hypothetical protein
LPIRFTVVSKPAISSSEHIGSSSSGRIALPRSATSTLTRSSCGSRARSSKSEPNSFSISRSAAITSRAWRSDRIPESALPMAAPYLWNVAASASGTPSIAVITVIGSGAASPATRSKRPRASAASTSSWVVFSTSAR